MFIVMMLLFMVVFPIIFFSFLIVKMTIYRLRESRIIKDGICYHSFNDEDGVLRTQYYIVGGKKKLFGIDWNSDHSLVSVEAFGNDYICAGSYNVINEFQKNSSRYMKYRDVKDLVLNLGMIILPDIEYYSNKIKETRLLIHSSSKSKIHKEYSLKLTNILEMLNKSYAKAELIKTKTVELITEIFLSYELEEYSVEGFESIFDKYPVYEKLLENLDSTFKEYKDYKDAYEELTRSLESV